MEMNQFQAAEMLDALEACDELRIVLSRLKRLGLITPEENREISQNIGAITETLQAKLPPDMPAD